MQSRAYPGPLVQRPRSPHRRRISSLVHSPLQMLYIVLPSLILVNLLLERVDERSPWALGGCIVLWRRRLLGLGLLLLGLIIQECAGG